MLERATLFGDRFNLLGVLSSPDEPSELLPAVLILNAGLIHRTGPNRLGVLVARAIAAQGFYALRFDLSGIGDSRDVGGGSYENRQLNDVRQAVDFVLEQTGASSVVILGLCSGADLAHRSALADPRVEGAVFMDGYAHRTWGFHRRYYQQRIFDFKGWRVRIKRYLGLGTRQAQPVEGPEQGIGAEIGWVMPERSKTAQDLVQFEERDMRLLYVFTGEWEEEFLYEDQLVEAYPEVDFGKFAKVAYFPLADHVFSSSPQRQALLEAVAGWLVAQFSDRCVKSGSRAGVG